MPRSNGPLITTRELADRWGVTVGALVNRRAAGRSPRYIKFGRGRGSRIRYRLSDIEEFERRMTVRPT